MPTICISEILSKKANGGSLSLAEIDHCIKEVVEDKIDVAQIGE